MASAVGALCCGEVAAQDTAADEAAAKDIRRLSTVTVQAQKRSESLQDVPISVTALNSDFVIENDVRTLEDLAGTVPGLVTTRDVGYGSAPLSLRGIGGANGGGNTFADEPVATYLNGVYVARPTLNTSDLVDIQSIEVLRGPQGTLYGRNSTAGAVVIKTNEPGDTFGGQLNASFSEFGESRLSGALNAPLTDKLSARLAVGVSKRDGFGTNDFDGSDIGGSDDMTIRGTLKYDATDTLSLKFIAEHFTHEASPALIAVTGIESTGGIASPFVIRSDLDDVLDSNTFSLNDTNLIDSESTSYTFSANWDLGWAMLDAITGHISLDTIGLQDSDSTSLQLFSNNGDISGEQFSQEVRLSSTLGENLDWIAGVIYFEEDIDQLFAIQNFNSLFGLGTNASFDATNTTKSYALFADGIYSLTDRLSLTLGGRWSHEEKDFANTQNVLTINTGTLPNLPTILGPLAGLTLPGGAPIQAPAVVEFNEEFDDFSPRVVFDYQATPDILLYGSYSQGFKSGGFNSFGLDTAFDSEDVDAYEIGAKSSWWDDRFRLNVAAFSYDYTDLQLRLPVPTGGVTIDNVGQAEISGAEIESQFAPIQGLTISASVSLLDAEITEGVLPAVATATPAFAIGIPLTLVDEDVSGNALTRAPDLQAFISANYVWELGNFDLGANISYKYQDEVYFLETNQDALTFAGEPLDEIDLRFSLSSQSDAWEVAIFGQNVTDSRHITQVTTLGGFPTASVNDPQKWGVQLALSF